MRFTHRLIHNDAKWSICVLIHLISIRFNNIIAGQKANLTKSFPWFCVKCLCLLPTIFYIDKLSLPNSMFTLRGGQNGKALLQACTSAKSLCLEHFWGSTHARSPFIDFLKNIGSTREDLNSIWNLITWVRCGKISSQGRFDWVHSKKIPTIELCSLFL